MVNESYKLGVCLCSGDIYQLDLTPNASRQQRWLPFTASKHARAHNRMVFNAVCAGGGSSGGAGMLCTVGMDRQLILWDVDSRKARYNLATLGGFTYCVVQSPINPGLSTAQLKSVTISPSLWTIMH